MDSSLISPTRSGASGRNAAALSDDAQATTVSREHLAEALDLFAIGVIFVDDEGRVLESNRAAVEVLRRRDGLSIRDDGRLGASLKGDESLPTLLRNARSSATRGQRHCAAVTVVSRQKADHPLHLCIAPLMGQSVPTLLAIFVFDHRKPRASASALFGRFYGLTPAESRLALELVHGKTLQQASTVLGISMHTARCHLKTIFSKTATNRQRELVKLLSSGLAMLDLDL